VTTSLQTKSSRARWRKLGLRVGKDSKDKQGWSHQRNASLDEAKKRSDIKACHATNQQSTNDKGLQIDEVWYRLQRWQND
jgi:hypothetical protein